MDTSRTLVADFIGTNGSEEQEHTVLLWQSENF